jgi:hypothetical protein
LYSLLPYLTKIWFCGRLIEPGVVRLPIVSGPKLVIDGQDWTALFHVNDEDAWLEIKGAFIGGPRPYQPKRPIGRAKKLQAIGTA